jgi:hypothetical protein
MNGGNLEQAHRHLRALIKHWNEFGPAHGLDELMHYADEYLKDTDPLQRSLADFNAQREQAVRRVALNPHLSGEMVRFAVDRIKD